MGSRVGIAALFDSNILIDHLKGIGAATIELGRYDDRAISIITWVELLAGATPASITGVLALLESFTTFPLDRDVAEQAAGCAALTASSCPPRSSGRRRAARGRLLVTRNTKDFPADDPGVRHPYVV